MKYVLDSNVALKTVLPEIDSPRAQRLITEYKQGLHELLAPDVFPVEVGHALTKAERHAAGIPTFVVESDWPLRLPLCGPCGARAM